MLRTGMRSGTLLKVGAIVCVLFATDMLLGLLREREIANARADMKHIRAQIFDTKAKRKQTLETIADLKHTLSELNADVSALHAQHAQIQRERHNLAKRAPESPMQNKPPSRSMARRNSPPHAAPSRAQPASSFGTLPKNRVLRAPPFCTEAPDKAAGKALPKYIFVAGIEGSGHHALKDVWVSLQEHTKLELIVYDQLFHSLGIENHASYHYASILKDTHIEHMQATFAKATQDASIVIDTQNSYPMGQGAGALAHPDLLMMKALDGVLFDLRVIILYRNPTDAILSAVRRFQDSAEYRYKNYDFQSRMVSETLAHLNNVLPLLPCGKVMAVCYEDLTADPASFVGELAQLVGVPASHLQTTFQNVHKRPKRKDTRAIARQRLIIDEFVRLQKPLWPLLASIVPDSVPDKAPSP